MGCIVYQTNKKTGVVYAYWNESYRDSATKKPTARRTYMGRVDPETNTIISKAESGKRNRSKIGSVKPQTDPSSEDNSRRIAELEEQVQTLNRRITELVGFLKESEAFITKIGKLASQYQPHLL